MADFDNIRDEAEGKVVAYFDAHAELARKVAWAFVVVQLGLCALIAVGSVSSVIAAAACFVTACVLAWQLVKTRPVATPA